MTFAKIPEARSAQASAWRRGLAAVAVTAVAFASMHAAGVSFQGVEKKHHHAHLGESTKQGGGIESATGFPADICCTKDQDEIAKCHAPRNCFGGPETPGDGDRCGACYTEPEDEDDGGIVPAYQNENVLGEPLAGGDDDDAEVDEDEEQKINEYGCYVGSKGWCENREHSHMSACECKEDCNGDSNVWSDDHKCDKNGDLTLEAQDSKVDELKQEKARIEAALEDAIEDQAVRTVSLPECDRPAHAYINIVPLMVLGPLEK
jgi:hypothetical protein